MSHTGVDMTEIIVADTIAMIGMTGTIRVGMAVIKRQQVAVQLQ